MLSGTSCHHSYDYWRILHIPVGDMTQFILFEISISCVFIVLSSTITFLTITRKSTLPYPHVSMNKGLLKHYFISSYIKYYTELNEL